MTQNQRLKLRRMCRPLENLSARARIFNFSASLCWSIMYTQIISYASKMYTFIQPVWSLEQKVAWAAATGESLRHERSELNCPQWTRGPLYIATGTSPIDSDRDRTEQVRVERRGRGNRDRSRERRWEERSVREGKGIWTMRRLSPLLQEEQWTVNRGWSKHLTSNKWGRWRKSEQWGDFLYCCKRNSELWIGEDQNT